LSDQQIPNFHDALLAGILVKDKTATLLLTQADGGEYRLQLTGVRGLQVDNFKEGNIILDLEVCAEHQAGQANVRQGLEHLFPVPAASAAPEYRQRHEELFARNLTELAKGETILLILNASYGAELVALCERVEFQKL
jgi:hypothetical protein